MATQQPVPTGAYFVSSAIPYVNATPHVGFAFELVATDALARWHRAHGRDVRFQTGTDENSLKNVQVAEAAGEPVERLVARNAEAYRALAAPLGLAPDDFVRTSADRRHREGVARLWRAVEAAGDLYRRDYTGRYCVGCEQFYDPRDLRDGRCPEHGTEPEEVAERNWFFRLSRHSDALHRLIGSGEIRITPESRRNEVLAFVERGLDDLSVSRSHQRARGFGIPVPGDPSQIVYVWFDALANYVTAPGYATGAPAYRRYWSHAAQRIHVVGKGITRFHAVYWPAILRSAGLPLPTRILVHGYVTTDGAKISKSAGTALDPVEAATWHGTDALRWYLLRHVPTTGDGDFSREALERAHRSELANGIGNLLSRLTGLLVRHRDGRVPAAPALPGALAEPADALRATVDGAVEEFRLDRALAAIQAVVARTNAHLSETQPWVLARETSPAAATRFDAVLHEAVEALRVVAVVLEPFLSGSSRRTLERLGQAGDRRPWVERAAWGGGIPRSRVVGGEALFPRER